MPATPPTTPRVAASVAPPVAPPPVAPPLLFGASAIALAVGELLDVQSLGYTPEQQVQHYLAAPTTLDVAAAAFLLGAALLVLAVATAWAQIHHQGQGRGQLASRVGLAMIGLGAIWYTTSRFGSDITDLQLTHQPVATQIAVVSADPGWVSTLDVPLLLAWLLGPVVLWIGLRCSRRCPWPLLVVYVLAVAIELGFAFVSLPVEAVTALTAIATVALMTLGPATTLSPRATHPAPTATKAPDNTGVA